MRRELIVVDNFYEDPDAVVRYSETLPYVAPHNAPEDEQLGRPILWRTSRFQRADICPFKSSTALIAKLEFLTGEKIDLDHWCRDFPLGADGLPAPQYETKPRTAWWNCCFQISHHPDEPGERVHNHDVFDSWQSVGAMGWAGIVYLSKDPPVDSGLYTYRHRLGARHEHFTASENWEQLDSFGNVYNRLVMHRGYIPHSGGSGWGSTIADGRKFQTFFFATLAPQETSPVSTHDVQLPMPILFG
jgi:hypothetical protein